MTQLLFVEQQTTCCTTCTEYGNPLYKNLHLFRSLLACTLQSLRLCIISHMLFLTRGNCSYLTGSKSFIGYIQRDISTSNNKWTEKWVHYNNKCVVTALTAFGHTKMWHFILLLYRYLVLIWMSDFYFDSGPVLWWVLLRSFNWIIYLFHEHFWNLKYNFDRNLCNYK